MAFDIQKAVGLGVDELEQSSSMPILRIVQDQSPELKKRDDKFIDGAEAGDILFNPTREVVERPVRVIPVGSTSIYTEWVPKDKGGGLVAMHPLTVVSHPDYAKDVKKKNDEWLGENELKYTNYLCVLALLNGEWTPAMFAFTSTQLKVARHLSGEIRKFRYKEKGMEEVTPPIFARSFMVDTVLEANKAGQEYYNFKISGAVVLDFKKDEALLEQAYEASKAARLELPKPDMEPQKALSGPDVEETGDEKPF